MPLAGSFNGVHHRADVVLPCLYGRDGTSIQATRAAKSPRVEGDEAGEGGQPRNELAHGRLFPNQLNGCAPGYRQHQVDRAIARDLVGQVGPFCGPACSG